MKTLLNIQKSKIILALLGTSILTSTLAAEQKLPTFAEIKSQIIQNERAIVLKKRDMRAQNASNRENLYVSDIFDKIRDAKRVQRTR
jgi:hypothetical protein